MEKAPMDGELLKREMAGEIVSGDGRTLELRIVPYNTPATVRDPGTEPYEEVWLPGVFDGQSRAADKVLVNFEHEPGIRGVVGRGRELRDTADAAEGTFRMLSGSDADKALELVNEKVVTGVSLEAIPLRSRVVDGVVQRVKARLLNVALCRNPAFGDAQVLAVREAHDTEFPGTVDVAATVYPDAMVTNDALPSTPWPAGLEPVRRADVDDLLQRVGFQPLERHTIVRTPWDGSPAVFDDESWQRACLLDRGEHFDDVKSRFAFPVLEPNGDLNVNGMHAAAQRLNQAQSSSQAKARAARKLVRYYRQAGEDPPAPLVALAGRA